MHYPENDCTFIGRLVKDPDARWVGAEKNLLMVTFDIAVNTRHGADKRDEALYMRCVTFGKKADYIYKYVGKGKRILVSGALQCNKYTDSDGINRKNYSLNVDGCKIFDFNETARDTQSQQQQKEQFRYPEVFPEDTYQQPVQQSVSSSPQPVQSQSPPPSQQPASQTVAAPAYVPPVSVSGSEQGISSAEHPIDNVPF